MNQEMSKNGKPDNEKFRFGCLHVLTIVILIVLVTTLVSVWWVKRNIYASKFEPTTLSIEEQNVLDSKLARLDASANRETATQPNDKREEDGTLIPEAYSEKGAKREISLTEKELNALIANQPDIAQRVVIDLADNLVSVKLVVPMDEEILFLGGKTLRLNLGVRLNYENEKPVVALQGVTLGGIPLPNAWLGNLKEKNLVNEFGTEGGFWKLFADGVEDLNVVEGRVQIKLKE